MEQWNNGTIKSRGEVALLLTVLILSAVLVISIVVATVTIHEMRMSESARQSVPAYFAAESGIEATLYNIRAKIPGDRPSPCPSPPCTPYLTETLLGGRATYEVYITDTDPDLIMKSIGEFMDVSRSIEISFPGAGW